MCRLRRVKKLRDLAAGMPQFEGVYTKVWAELNDAQRCAVDERLNGVRERQSEMRQNEYVEKLRLGETRTG